MQHLDTERVAAFDHEAPTADELAHLAACAVCRAERDAYAVLAELAMHDAFVADSADASRLTDWESLSAVLRREGMLTSAPDHRVPESPLVVRALDGSGERIARPARPSAPAPAATPTRRMPTWMRSAAAAVLLVVGGVAAGRLSVGARLFPVGAVGSSLADAGTGVALQPASLAGSAPFASLDQATAVLNNAQLEYERASLWLAANDTTVRASDVYRARLAALDQMMAASREALRDAPQDPVLNHYFLAASTAREATLQQLGGALPVDKRIEGY